jgi:hypothetical protein
MSRYRTSRGFWSIFTCPVSALSGIDIASFWNAPGFGLLFEEITRLIINSMNYRYLALLTALAIVPLSSAKRLPPPNVKPVLSGGVEYSAHGDGTRAWVAEVATDKELWTAKVFRIRTHWWKGEEDNQWVYISDLKLEPNALFIKDEREDATPLI